MARGGFPFRKEEHEKSIILEVHTSYYTTRALLLQYIFGVLWNFKTTGTIVFQNKNNKLIFKFILSYIFTFVINSVLLKILVNYINDYLAQAILILPIALLSFFILKYWVFKVKQDS